MEFQECVNSGIALFQEGKVGPAIEKLEEALKLQPANGDVRQMLEMLKEQAGAESDAAQVSADEAKHRAEALGITDVDQAIADYTEALNRNPHDASVQRDLADAYYLRGLACTSKEDHPGAVDAYSEAINNEPNHLFAFNKRGWAHLKIGNHDHAIEDFGKVLQCKPDDPQAKQNLANAYGERAIAHDKKGDYAHAIADFEKVLTFKPGDGTTVELLAMAKAALAKN
jgi:tetratricopeptide (TPR) repeat protein